MGAFTWCQMLQAATNAECAPVAERASASVGLVMRRCRLRGARVLAERRKLVGRRAGGTQRRGAASGRAGEGWRSPVVEGRSRCDEGIPRYRRLIPPGTVDPSEALGLGAASNLEQLFVRPCGAPTSHFARRPERLHRHSPCEQARMYAPIRCVAHLPSCQVAALRRLVTCHVTWRFQPTGVVYWCM